MTLWENKDVLPNREEAGKLLRSCSGDADSIEQCHLRGEIARAMEAGKIRADELVEVGDIIAGRARGRTAEDQITVFDSTGVAVQDMMISRAVYEQLRGIEK